MNNMPTHQQPTTLSFSKAEVGCYLGIAIFVVSLTLPAIKHGKTMLGIECVAGSSIVAFFPGRGRKASELADMCRASLVAHVCCIILVTIVCFRLQVPQIIRSLITGLVLLTCCYLVAVPYSEIEEVYPGYYLWLASLVVLSLSHYVSDWNIVRDSAKVDNKRCG
ncbi:MAG: hypothetical protein HKN47_22295 [Pirellulaceae bacterium]|nr:hypothetical protein [Pirellulaceae bacterium]